MNYVQSRTECYDKQYNYKFNGVKIENIIFEFIHKNFEKNKYRELIAIVKFWRLVEIFYKFF